MAYNNIDRLLNIIDNKDFRKETLKSLNYSCFAELLQATRAMANGKTIYQSIINTIYSENQKRIATQETISIVFIVEYFETWGGKDLYFLLKENPKFDVQVCVALNTVLGKNQYDKFANTYSSLLESGITPISSFNPDTLTHLTWNEMGLDPDLVFIPDPYVNQSGDMNIFNITIDKLCLYIPYAFDVIDSEDHSHLLLQFDLPVHNIVWKRFAPAQISMKYAQEYSFIGNSNMVFSGYPKMDTLLMKKHTYDASMIWKIPEGQTPDSVKKIIYAPHHSLPGTSKILLATFMENWKFMYSLAKNNPTISWIIRPHPQLGNRCERAGLMSEADYQNYLSMWNSLPNAKVCQYGGYFDIFETSDAMIMDCGSFLAEYLYVNKPLLFLLTEHTTFNPLGQECINCYETAMGNDFNAIEKFVNSIKNNEADPKSQLREDVFNNNFNIKQINGKSASQYICDYLCSEFRDYEKNSVNSNFYDN